MRQGIDEATGAGSIGVEGMRLWKLIPVSDNDRPLVLWLCSGALAME